MDAPDHAPPAAGSGGVAARVRRELFARPVHRVIAFALLFAACWVAAAVKITEVTGLDGLAVGVPLAAAPVPIVVGAFLLLAKARPQPWPHVAFALAWGAGAGALAALYANSWSIEAIIDRSGTYRAELLGLTVVAPFVEEAAKGSAVLLLLIFRRHWVRAPVDGLVLAATTAAGFAFTENVLYFGRAFGEGGDDGDAAAQTATVFLGRGILTPFAHPLFTSAIGLGLGFAVLARRRGHAVAIAVGGYLVSVGLHSAWNGAAWKSTVEDEPLIMLSVYFAVMLPLLAGLFAFGAHLRRAQLAAVTRQLPWYVAAGWFSWNEPQVLGSITDRSRQRRAARVLCHGKSDRRLLASYQWNATALAELRERTARGQVTPAEFTPRERALLDELWAARTRLRDLVTNTLPTPQWAPVPPVTTWPPAGGSWAAPPGAAGQSAPTAVWTGPYPSAVGWTSPTVHGAVRPTGRPEIRSDTVAPPWRPPAP